MITLSIYRNVGLNYKGKALILNNLKINNNKIKSETKIDNTHTIIIVIKDIL